MMGGTTALDDMMPGRARYGWLLCGAACAAATVAAGTLLSAQDRPSRQFRAGVTMVPVDVRVLDRHGAPVTDLTKDNFFVFEDGVPQIVQGFVKSALVPEPAAAMAPLSAASLTLVPQELRPQNRRVFLIVLGRGRQTGPVKIVEALRTLVRDRLLPQDQVAVMGYNRATDFTTDHEAIAEVLERFGRLHTAIEASIAQNQNLVMGVLGPAEMPPFIQDKIDEVFGEGLYGGRPLPEPAADIRRDQARAVQSLRQAAERQLDAVRPVVGEGGQMPALSEAMDSGLLGADFEDYVGQAVAALTDLGNVHKGLDYLRRVEGEKHLLMVTVAGNLGLHDTRDEDRLAALAADARVALDLVHTAGVVAAPVAGSRGPIAAVPTASQVFAQTFAVKGMRAIAELSGGQAWAFQSGEHAMSRLDLGTRFRYLLGYVPANDRWDGEYRAIRIEVDRPDVSVLYRRGYYASGPAKE